MPCTFGKSKQRAKREAETETMPTSLNCCGTKQRRSLCFDSRIDSRLSTKYLSLLSARCPTREFSERGRQIIFTRVSQHQSRSARFAAMTGSGCAPRTDAIHHKVFSMKTRSEGQLFCNLQSVIADSKRRCFDRQTRSGTDADSSITVFDSTRSVDSFHATLNLPLKRSESRTTELSEAGMCADCDNFPR